jgi:hypothetical protein
LLRGLLGLVQENPSSSLIQEHLDRGRVIATLFDVGHGASLPNADRSEIRIEADLWEKSNGLEQKTT